MLRTTHETLCESKGKRYTTYLALPLHRYEIQRHTTKTRIRLRQTDVAVETYTRLDKRMHTVRQFWISGARCGSTEFNLHPGHESQEHIHTAFVRFQ